ncbi:MAG: hypothetical protein FJ009_14605 [Chloroflexi bacterium]|nr:hypothetical protein [Chloroflexota bacterium]
MSHFRLIGFVLIALGAAGMLAACASPASAPAPTPTVVAKPTTAPPPTPVPTSDGCIKCHSDKETLKKLAVTKVEKSAETQGEG